MSSRSRSRSPAAGGSSSYRSRSRSPPRRERQAPGEPSSKLYVGNLNFSCVESDLRAEFEKFGQVEQCLLAVDRDTGRSRGFGFITYIKQEDASAALKAMKDSEFQGRTIQVEFARPRDANRPARSFGGDRSSRGGRGSFRSRGGSSGGGYRGGRDSSYGGGRDSYRSRDGGDRDSGRSSYGGGRDRYESRGSGDRDRY